MKRQHLANIFATLLLMFISTTIYAATGGDAKRDIDTDTRMVDAKVVEVTDAHISVIARTGVEHVIAVGRTDTEVTIDGRIVSLKEVREGDVITIELDAYNPVKFAKNIEIRPEQIEVARYRR